MKGWNNMKLHGELTTKIARKISQGWEKRGYTVLYDHDPSNGKIGKIVSVIKNKYRREDELSQIDIAVVEKSSDKVFALIEIEETNDRPKTFLSDIFGVLFGEYICFKRKELQVKDFTTLIVVGVNKTNHNDRNKHILDRVNRVKTSLGTQNAKIREVIIKTYTDEKELMMQLPLELNQAFKRE
jgi:hypothetical protein